MALTRETFNFIEECLNGYIRLQEREVEASSCDAAFHREEYFRIGEDERAIEKALDDLEGLLPDVLVEVGEIYLENKPSYDHIAAPKGFNILRFRAGPGSAYSGLKLGQIYPVYARVPK